MKKFVCLLLILFVIPAVALSDENLSNLSFDELLALRQQIESEIMSRPEWKEVTVPSGTWVVGVDIPEGAYSISPTGRGGYITIRDDSHKLLISQGIRDQESAFGKMELKNGYTIEIESGSLIFAPPKGLGF